jgi:hypothetical protein
MFFAVFGGLWFAGAASLAGKLDRQVLILIVLATLALLLAAHKVFRRNRNALRELADPARDRRTGRTFALINAAQWLAVVGVASLLPAVNLSAWVIPSIILIVGAHLLPLARLFRYPPHAISGVALILLAVTYPFAFSGGPQGPAGCLGAGIILWLSAGRTLVAAAGAGISRPAVQAQPRPPVGTAR